MELKNQPVARMIYAASESCADLLYATGFFVPDPFWYVRDNQGITHIILSALEVDRGRRTARVDQVHEWPAILERYQRRHPEQVNPDERLVIAFFLSELHIDRVCVPADFPLSVADFLRAREIELVVIEDFFWPERQYKRVDEVAEVSEALRLTGQAMAVAIDMIASAVIGKDGYLYGQDKVLTSERVRGEIHAFLVRHEAVPQRTIVAGGRQGADPHEVGTGPLPAHQPIILDIFPRMLRSGYWGDMTRTVCRGEPSDRCQRAWQAVKESQEVAFAHIRAGVDGKAVHSAVTDYLTQAGFATGRSASGLQEGFFHGTGHGLGLEIHELPRISWRSMPLASGHLVTVEPGLYYPDMGGVRIEDVVLVEEQGCRNLTDVPKIFIV
ncbi:MAG: aminopeptidase P family protein [Magnetococcales bacterium]|nr:aminopeptidase P family protein [Magnetococcales bacterium]